MIFSKNIDSHKDDDAFPFNENASNDDDLDTDDKPGEEDQEAEDIEELEEIESKIDKGEDYVVSALDDSQLAKTRMVYSCPRCKKIFLNNRWVKDTVTELFTIRTELAYCPKCLKKTYGDFVGSIEIYDKDLGEKKEQFIEIAKQVEREMEDAPPFENIIDIVEKNGILFIFVNTTRLALEIGRRLRQEMQGGVQYEWFERNQYLRVKWYYEVDNRNYFKERIRALKQRRFGMFSFEEEE